MTSLEKPKVAIYLRVSTDEQTADNQEPESRRLALGRYPLERFDHVIVREVESAVKERPGWRAVLELARAGELKAVVAWSLDRIGRRMWGVLEDVRTLDRYGVELVTVREPWCDTGSPARPLMLAIFGWVAEHEHDRLRERTIAGLARARAQGRRAGRPRVVIPPMVVALALELRREGVAWRRVPELIKRELGFEPALSTLREACAKNGPPPDPRNPARDLDRTAA